jgi:hypothetical protein
VSLALALSTCATAASAAPSPAAYRSGLNAMCRSTTATMSQLLAKMKRAQQAKDWHAYGFALGQLLRAGLREDETIEATPIPTRLRPQMVPAIRLLEHADAMIRQAVRLFEAGNLSGGVAELKKLDSYTGPVNRYLDAAGLRDCGSNQS